MTIGIGSGKCGTTSLYDWLCQSSEFNGGSAKEHHYFNRTRDKLSTETYFNNIGNIDITPEYLITKQAPKQAYNLFPYAKVFCIVREPCERAWSQYNMMLKRHATGERKYSWLNKSFIELFNSKNNLINIREMGLYHKHLIRWGKYFDVKVFEFGDLIKRDGFNEFCRWIGIKPFEPNRTILNSSTFIKLPDNYNQYLKQYYTEPNIKLKQLTGISWQE